MYARIIAVYELADLILGEPSESGNVEDTKSYLQAIGQKWSIRLANIGVADVTPYLREAVHNTSTRLLPEKPLVVYGIPTIDDDTEFTGTA
ncbi:hypothetical protein [Nocardia callitridis]|uniref:Uncharacterized protein n=1 Tax=Nocardia callitridis TaxID=648753 RepID=A0ABP9K3N1_9NOCA